MKRVLIIAYYFNDENMGAIRLRRIARYLPQLGFEPVILTASPETVVVNDIPGVHIERVKALDLKAVYERIKGRGKNAEAAEHVGQGALPESKNTKLTAWLNRWLMIPDKQIPWLRPAVRRGRELLSSESFDLIFASLEPRTNLLAASRLAKISGLPCVMEYRDLWNNNPYHHQQQPSFVHRWLHQRLEKNAVARAARLSTVCVGIEQYLKRLPASAAEKPIGLIYNFYDPDEYPARESTLRSGPFTILYAGAMYFSRNPQAFFKGFRLFLDRNHLLPKDVRFRWMGVTAALPELEDTLSELELAPFIDFEGIVEHEKAINALCRADVSLILQSPEDTVHIPGKLYEAFGARVPVLVLSNPCETTELVEKVGGGICVAHEPEALCSALQQFWERHRSGRAWQYNEIEVEQFSAGQMVGRLIDLFNQVSL